MSDESVGAATRNEPSGPGVAMPRWVKAFIAIGVLLVIVFIALHFAGLSPVRHGT